VLHSAGGADARGSSSARNREDRPPRLLRRRKRDVVEREERFNGPAPTPTPRAGPRSRMIAITTTPPLGSVGYEAQLNAKGEQLMIQRLQRPVMEVEHEAETAAVVFSPPSSLGTSTAKIVN
jgi:hypothetical protein